jgi:hypothetical protein
MATIQDLIRDLKNSNKDNHIAIFQPSGLAVQSNFHITEIGKTTKHFVDCGGDERKTTNTTLQIWVANDKDHRLTVGKLLKIIEAGNELVSDEDEIIFEYDNGYTLGLFGVELCQILDTVFNIFLSKRKAACLAPDQCGIKPQSSCCGNKGCC